METDFNIKILVAPLDWGLGHACRCIPLIKHLISLGCTVILAADGPQKKLLSIEFPQLTLIHLPGYHIQYSKNSFWFTLKILKQLPKIVRSIKTEQTWLQSVVKEHNIDAVISDNRYGLYQSKIPVAFITHQLRIQTPFSITTRLLQKFHYKLINTFSECWVPDFEDEPTLAGKLSHPKILPGIPVKYLGGLSRFTRQISVEEYDALIVLSGPEPQRTILENRILTDLKNLAAKVLFVRGLPCETANLPSFNNVEIMNHLGGEELSVAFTKAKFIISRSGYTTVMDILKLGKKSILIPTPGQTEQEYLATHLQQQQWCLSISQKDFNLQNALLQAASFPYNLHGINMELYKNVLNEFVAKANHRKVK